MTLRGAGRACAPLALAVMAALAPLAASAQDGAAQDGATAPADPAPQVSVETLAAGEGARPPEHSFVLINYKGMLPDGTVFDQAERMPMALDEVVPGFALGLVQMQRGGRYRLTIPPQLGYGPRGVGPIPPNSTLVFEIDLIDFKTPEDLAAMMEQMHDAQVEGPPPPAPGAQPGQ